MGGMGGVTGDTGFTVLIFVAFSLHEVDRESSLNCVVPDEEVQGKGDVGAGKDPPGIVVDLLHRLECVSSIPWQVSFVLLLLVSPARLCGLVRHLLVLWFFILVLARLKASSAVAVSVAVAAVVAVAVA